MSVRDYPIGEAAKAAGVTVKAIRYYEEIGLIPHTRRRTNGGQGAGHRILSAADVGRLRFIHQARALGLALPEIRELVAIAETRGCPGNRPEYKAILARHLKYINERIERLLELRNMLAGLMDLDRTSGSNACTWEICGCMDAAGSATNEDRRLFPKPHPHRDDGGNHV